MSSIPTANQIEDNAPDKTLIDFLTSAPIGQFHALTSDQIQILRLALDSIPVNAQPPQRTRAQAQKLLDQRSLQLPTNKSAKNYLGSSSKKNTLVTKSTPKT